jgi:histidine ammonia-lyase
MLAQYTQAALVSECKMLAQPAGADSIPTSGVQEDHVSMGWLSGLKARDVVERVRTVLAIEGVCAAQALDLRSPLEPARGTGASKAALRKTVPKLEHDREVAADLASAEVLVAEGTLVGAAEDAVGPLR